MTGKACMGRAPILQPPSPPEDQSRAWAPGRHRSCGRTGAGTMAERLQTLQDPTPNQHRAAHRAGRAAFPPAPRRRRPVARPPMWPRSRCRCPPRCAPRRCLQHELHHLKHQPSLYTLSQGARAAMGQGVVTRQRHQVLTRLLGAAARVPALCGARPSGGHAPVL